MHFIFFNSRVMSEAVDVTNLCFVAYALYDNHRLHKISNHEFVAHLSQQEFPFAKVTFTLFFIFIPRIPIHRIY